MPNSEFDNIDINEELEFNNGVGDALKQKEEYTFSWKKTVTVLSLGVVVIILLTFGVLEIGKSAIEINQALESADEEIALDLNAPVVEASETNWDVLPEDDKAQVEPLVPKQEPAPSKPKPPVINKVNVVKKTPPAPKKIESKPTASIYRVIAGSFSNYNNAKSELSQLKKKGVDGYIWSLTSAQNKVSYKIQVGAFKSSSSAQTLVNELKQKNIQSFISKH